MLLERSKAGRRRGAVPALHERQVASPHFGGRKNTDDRFLVFFQVSFLRAAKDVHEETGQQKSVGWHPDEPRRQKKVSCSTIAAADACQEGT